MKGSIVFKVLTIFGLFASLTVVTYFTMSSRGHEESRRELISLSSSDNTIQPGLRFQKVRREDGDEGATATSTGTSTGTSTSTANAGTQSNPTTSETSTQTGPKTSDASTQTVDQTPFFWTCPGVNDGKNFDRIRKDYNDLTEAERQLYIKALQQAYNEGHYSLFVNLHATIQNEDYAHNLASFFAWHRKYLLEFENMLRSLGDEFRCVTIPFWDWAQEARVCGQIRSGGTSSSEEVHGNDRATCESFASVSHIIQDFGGGGELGSINADDCNDEFRKTSDCDESRVGCITQGPFKDWKDHFGRRCVLRHTEATFQQEGMMAGTAAIDKVMHSETTLNRFYWKLYGFGHGATHMMVGGHMGNMLSPTDPLFWSHHCFVDKVWAVWQDCKDAHENLDDVMFTPRMQREKNMPFVRYHYSNHSVTPTFCSHRKRTLYQLTLELQCMTVRPNNEWSQASFDGWLKGDLKTKCETAASSDQDAFSATDRTDRHKCAGSDVTRVTSELVPGWNDKFMPKDFSDTHNMGVEGSNVLYWPDDYDRKTIFMKNQFCNFTKWSVCDYVRSGGDGSMEIDGQTLAERCGLAMLNDVNDYADTDTSTVATNTENGEIETNTVDNPVVTKEVDGDTALAFLEVGHSKASQALKQHHAAMWTQQQTDSIGETLQVSAEDDVTMFAEVLDKEVTKDLQSKGKTLESSTKEEKEAAAKRVMGDVLTKIAEHECDVLGSNKVEIQERFEHLRVWFGSQTLKENAKRCSLRPGQCNLVSFCKHLQLQKHCTPPEDENTPSTCSGTCDTKTTHDDCENESTCTWIPTGEDGSGRCL